MRLLNVDQLRERVPISRNKLNRMVDCGEFIQPVQIAGQLMFVEDELTEWLTVQPRGLFPQKSALKSHQEERRSQGEKKCEAPK